MWHRAIPAPAAAVLLAVTMTAGCTGEADSRDLDADLIDAAWADDVPRARRLIAAGADVNAKDGTQQSAYLIATSEGYSELLELTLQHGADVGSLDSFDGTGLIRAAERGHAAVVGRLLRAGVDVDHVNNLGWTALHEAIVLGSGGPKYVETVRLLVAGGADVRLASQRDGVAPLAHARGKGYREIAGTLQAALSAPRRRMRVPRCGRRPARALRTMLRSPSVRGPTWRAGTSAAGPRCCWRPPRTGCRWRGSWWRWARTRTRWTTATTRLGWSPA